MTGGQSRANPCRYPWRLVAGRWQGVGSRDLTTALAPQGVSARQVGARYRRRWRIEAAFALTKRVVALASGWTSSAQAVQWQIDATLLVSAVRLTMCPQVAEAWGEPRARGSVEMVCRAFSPDRRAVPRGECHELVPCVVAQATRLGVVKRWRPQQRERQHLDSMVWDDP